MSYITILGHVCCGRVVLFGTNQLVQRITLPKLRVGVLTELAVTSCVSVLQRPKVKAVQRVVS